MKCLLAHHAAVDHADQRGVTPLSEAAEKGHVDVVKCLLAHHAAVDGADQEGVTPLYIAARNGYLDVVTCLLAYHAAVDRANQEGLTPLPKAAQKGHLDVVRRLVEAGAAVDRADNAGRTPTIAAASYGHAAVLRALATHGADLSIAAPNGLTAVWVAADHGRLGALRALEELGADTQTAVQGETPAEIAIWRGHKSCAAWLARCRGWRPIHRACDQRRGRAHVLALLREGADPSLMSAAGETPLRICRLVDPATGALPADAATTETIELAAMPWHPERHHMFPDSFRAVVLTALLVQHRLQRRVQEQELEQGGAGADGEAADGGVAVVPQLCYGCDFLTHEIWVLWIVPQLPRFAWATPAGGRAP